MAKYAWNPALNFHSILNVRNDKFEIAIYNMNNGKYSKPMQALIDHFNRYSDEELKDYFGLKKSDELHTPFKLADED